MSQNISSLIFYLFSLKTIGFHISIPKFVEKHIYNYFCIQETNKLICSRFKL